MGRSLLWAPHPGCQMVRGVGGPGARGRKPIGLTPCPTWLGASLHPPAACPAGSCPTPASKLLLLYHSSRILILTREHLYNSTATSALLCGCLLGGSPCQLFFSSSLLPIHYESLVDLVLLALTSHQSRTLISGPCCQPHRDEGLEQASES